MHACSLKNPPHELEKSKEVNTKARPALRPATSRYWWSPFLIALGTDSLKQRQVRMPMTALLSGVDHL